MKYSFSFILFILFHLLFSQNREIINGEILSEENTLIMLYNKNSYDSINTVTNTIFKLKVKESDTLILNAFNKEYIITSKEIKEKYFYIDINRYTIDEVIISPLKFSGDLAADIKENQSKLKSYKQQQILNKVQPTNLDLGEQVSFYIAPPKNNGPPVFYRRSFNMYKSSQKKLKKAKTYIDNHKIRKLIQEYFGAYFFINDLKIKDSDIQNFILFCDYNSNINELAQDHKFSEIQVLLFKLAIKYNAFPN
ncbi:hypothetical protein UJ101_01065 [Flavobacteriaceae bacterium UJ101]|nr:hypothetical protein UJ101_01065 [Flavobacteriaceae bacterium UJ101]